MRKEKDDDGDDDDDDDDDDGEVKDTDRELGCCCVVESFLFLASKLFPELEPLGRIRSFIVGQTFALRTAQLLLFEPAFLFPLLQAHLHHLRHHGL